MNMCNKGNKKWDLEKKKIELRFSCKTYTGGDSPACEDRARFNHLLYQGNEYVSRYLL